MNIARKEHFGYVLFDIEKLTHKFVRSVDEVHERIEMLPERLFQRTDILSAPIRIYWELTNACNLRCKHCHNASGKPLEEELSTKEAIKVLQGIKEDNIFDVRFSGGEPTQRPDWFEVLSESKRLGLATSFNTNGVYGSQHDSVIEMFIALDPQQITFSIDGNKEHHDYLRGKGSFDAVVRSLADTYSLGYRHLRINSVITKGYSKSLNEILELAGQYCDEMNCFYMRISGRANNLINEAMSMEELKEVDRIVEMARKNYQNVNFIFNEGACHTNSIKDEIDFTGLSRGLPDGHTRFNLFSNGAIQPGGYTPRLTNIYYLGNIREEAFSFLRIWHKSKTLNNYRKKSLELQRKCYSCDYFTSDQCQGGSMEMEIVKEHTGTNIYCPIDLKQDGVV